jgi:hypothetical protein
MQAVRQIYADLPDSIVMPIEFRHRKVEIIILPLARSPSIATDGLPSSAHPILPQKLIKLYKESHHGFTRTVLFN